MNRNNQITALLQLVDDPDNEVFETVADQLLLYGKNIIPKLEQLWEVTVDETVQNRIELLIHRVHFSDLQQELLQWSREANPGLMHGALLVAKYKYPGLDTEQVNVQMEKLKRNIWLELNDYLTPLEQANVVNSILFNYYKIQGYELTTNNPDYFFINHLLEAKKGNAFSIGILYLILCEILDIPLFAVGLPRQFVLAYFDSLYPFFNMGNEEPVQQIQFYLDPVNGMLYTQAEVDIYLRKIQAEARPELFQPLGNREIICTLLEELIRCYDARHQTDNAVEITELLRLIKTSDKND